MSTTMTALHPSNPYYHIRSQQLDQESNTILQPYNPPKPKQQSPSDAPTPPSQLQRCQSEAPGAPSQQPQQRRKSSNVVTYRTRSIGGPFSAGVVFERDIDLSPPTDDEIIIATVRITNSFRRASIEGCQDLPSRPQKRSFLRRMSTRISGAPDPDRYTAIKLPRRDYKRYFARDRQGNYAGEEPEREWSKEDLEREFGQYQDMPLRSIPGYQEFGEGASTTGSCSVPATAQGAGAQSESGERWSSYAMGT